MLRPLAGHDDLLARRVRSRAVRGGAALLAGVGLVGCGDEPRLSKAPGESFRVVVGDTVDERVERSIEEIPGRLDSFRPSRPRRCDTFRQESRRPVDILWVVDSSASMANEQEKLASYFASLARDLAAARVDFHVGVITTDVDREEPALGIGPGWLRHPAGADAHYVACAPEGKGVRCNVGDGSVDTAIAALEDLVRVGVDGSQQEKGLLAAMLALSEPLRSGRNAGFLRDDAALSIVFVSDEEDSSCGPSVFEPPCLASPSCKCEDPPAWGSVEYFSRFFQGLKGYGNESAVRIGAIVATEGTTRLRFSDETGLEYVGCSTAPDEPCALPGGSGAECAFHAPRYQAVAVASGGTAVSICADEYGTGLADLGLAGAGLRSEFLLGRLPVPETIDVTVVPSESVLCDDAATCPAAYPDCVRGRCAQRVRKGLPLGWEHVICSGGSVRNAIRFSGGSIPEPLHEIEVCYDVDVGHDLQCQ